MTPNDRKYTKSHEWVKIEGDLATIGITDHAQAALGDITYVSGFAPGKQVKQAGECGSIESVKAASDIYAPIGGEVDALNDALTSAPETINQDPYGAGWILKLRAFNAAEINDLLNAASYDALVESTS
jgi:glycine cleavage system H protein